MWRKSPLLRICNASIAGLFIEQAAENFEWIGERRIGERPARPRTSKKRCDKRSAVYLYV